MTSKIDLSKLSDAGKDALILRLLPLFGQLEAAFAWIAELEARSTKLEGPAETPDNTSFSPIKGQKSGTSAVGDEPPRKGQFGVARIPGTNPDRIVDARLDACPPCTAARPARLQTWRQAYDRIELPLVQLDVNGVRLFGSRCTCCGERVFALAPAGLKLGPPPITSPNERYSRA